ncbi:MAG: hypothetical protein HJJLKODD_02230 [Phycisphaerae bacterium]|nr:hypothetical protein [Phycisphaerae bacterium]
MRTQRSIWQFLWPWVIGFTLLQLGPILFSAGLSFCECTGNDWKQIHWVGWKNYEQLLAIDYSYTITPKDPASWTWLGGRPQNPRFFHALFNTLIYTIMSVPLSLTIALLLAQLLHQPLRGISFFRTAYYLPYFIGGVGTILVWQWMFNPETGWINLSLITGYKMIGQAIGWLGFSLPEWQPPRWLYDPLWCKPALALMDSWSCGGAMLIFLAALCLVPRHLYDAARLEGAGRWTTFRQITLPLISPALLFNIITATITATRTFSDAFLLQHWSQQDGLLLIMIYLYEQAFELPNHWGYASAITWILAAMLLLFSIVSLLLSRRWIYYEVRG